MIKETGANKVPGESWQYGDMNTDTPGLLAEKASGKKLPGLLSELCATIGANHEGSIALTSHGTYSPFPGVEYGSQSYCITEDDVIYSSGSYVQHGCCDLRTDLSIVFLSDWAVNWEVVKEHANRERILSVINHLRLESAANYLLRQ